MNTLGPNPANPVYWDQVYQQGERVHTHMSEAVSRQVVALKKPLVTHGASVRLHPYTHRAPTSAS